MNALLPPHPCAQILAWLDIPYYQAYRSPFESTSAVIIHRLRHHQKPRGQVLMATHEPSALRLIDDILLSIELTRAPHAEPWHAASFTKDSLCIIFGRHLACQMMPGFNWPDDELPHLFELSPQGGLLLQVATPESLQNNPAGKKRCGKNYNASVTGWLSI